MHAATIQQKTRGVYCLYCGKPIRLSPSLIRREAVIKNENRDDQQWHSKVFPARCRTCLGESIYMLNQIVELNS